MIEKICISSMHRQENDKSLGLKSRDGFDKSVVFKYVFYILLGTTKSVCPSSIASLVSRVLIIMNKGIVSEILAMGTSQCKLKSGSKC